jgi:hypothetical protein
MESRPPDKPIRIETVIVTVALIAFAVWWLALRPLAQAHQENERPKAEAPTGESAQEIHRNKTK